MLLLCVCLPQTAFARTIFCLEFFFIVLAESKAAGYGLCIGLGILYCGCTIIVLDIFSNTRFDCYAQFTFAIFMAKTCHENTNSRHLLLLLLATVACNIVFDFCFNSFPFKYFLYLVLEKFHEKFSIIRYMEE